MKRIGYLVALAVVATAILVPAGQAAPLPNDRSGPYGIGLTPLASAGSTVLPDDRPGVHGIGLTPVESSFYTPAQLENMAKTWQARAQYEQSNVEGFTPAQLENMAKTWQARAEYELTRDVGVGVDTPATEPTPAAADDGFDYRVVGFAIGGGIIALLLAASLVVVARRSRHPVPG